MECYFEKILKSYFILGTKQNYLHLSYCKNILTDLKLQNDHATNSVSWNCDLVIE